MKKIVYILTVTAVILSCFIVPVSAADDSDGYFEFVSYESTNGELELMISENEYCIVLLKTNPGYPQFIIYEDGVESLYVDYTTHFDMSFDPFTWFGYDPNVENFVTLKFQYMNCESGTFGEFFVYKVKYRSLSGNDGSYQDGYDKGYADAEEVYESEIAELQLELLTIWSDAFSQGKTAGRSDTFSEMHLYIMSKGFNAYDIDDVEGIFEFYENNIGLDYETIFNKGKDAGFVEGKEIGFELGKAEGFDSSFITEGVDSIVEGTSKTFLEVLDVEILGYKLSAIVVGLILVMFVYVVSSLIGHVL